MKLEEYLTRANADHIQEQKVFQARNDQYASDEDIFENTKEMAQIAQALGIKVTFEDIEWIYFIGKLVRESHQHNAENYRDGVNYFRRMEAAKEE